MLLCRRVTSSFFISGFLPFIGDFLTGRSFSADTCRWQARAYVQVAGNGGSLKRWDPGARGLHCINRSEEHTSELQSLMRISYAVFCLKKKRIILYSLHNLKYHIIL